MFNPARVKDISTDQGFPFDVQIVDLNLDGKADVLASNHQPDNCLPFTSSEVPGRVYALEQPASGDLFVDAWTTRILLDDIRPNPTLAPVRPPGRLAPGRAQAFAPIGVLDGVIKPSVVVSGDEAGKVWLLTPVRRRDASDWRYRTSVIFDINAFYGPNTTQTPMADPFGITISTVGAVAVRHDGPGGIGFAELYIPVFEAKDIHVLTLRPGAPWDRVACAPNESLSCPAP